MGRDNFFLNDHGEDEDDSSGSEPEEMGVRGERPSNAGSSDESDSDAPAGSKRGRDGSDAGPSGNAVRQCKRLCSARASRLKRASRIRVP
eukprot:6682304-Pyramimonas_sp.AAC.1